MAGAGGYKVTPPSPCHNSLCVCKNTASGLSSKSPTVCFGMNRSWFSFLFAISDFNFKKALRAFQLILEATLFSPLLRLLFMTL